MNTFNKILNKKTHQNRMMSLLILLKKQAVLLNYIATKSPVTSLEGNSDLPIK